MNGRAGLDIGYGIGLVYGEIIIIRALEDRFDIKAGVAHDAGFIAPFIEAVSTGLGIHLLMSLRIERYIGLHGGMA